MDDNLMYNSTLEQHVALLLQVFEILQQNEFHLKLSKCAFATGAQYLGAHLLCCRCANKTNKSSNNCNMAFSQNSKWFERIFGSHWLLQRDLSSIMDSSLKSNEKVYYFSVDPISSTSLWHSETSPRKCSNAGCSKLSQTILWLKLMLVMWVLELFWYLSNSLSPKIIKTKLSLHMRKNVRPFY